MKRNGLLISLQVGMPQTIGRPDAQDPMDRIWRTGFFKTEVSSKVWLTLNHLDGDGQADLQNHGGPEKAVNVYPIEHYAYWEQVLDLTELPRGAFGENFTIQDLLESEVCIGDVFEVGEALVQVSQPRQPCWKLARRWRRRELALEVQTSGRTGWYFRVLREGYIQSGQSLILIERPCPTWTIAAANAVMHQQPDDVIAIRALASSFYLAARWRNTLKKRIETGQAGNSTARLYGSNG